MTTQLSTLPEFNRDQIDLIKRTVAKSATDDELKLFMYTCEKRGLDPLAKQIYFQKRRGKNGDDNLTIITGIDGYRLQADRTGLYAGNDDPVFDDEKNPSKASVTVYKLVKGVRCAFTATARWDEYYPGDALGFMWRKMPNTMIGKCAEALALRKAFPQELSGQYIPEEMAQAGPEIKYDAPHTAQTETPAVIEAKPIQASVFNSKDAKMQNAVAAILKKQKVDEALWGTICDKLEGKPSTELKNVIAEVVREASL
jgi:phage recombination protein Bet